MVPHEGDIAKRDGIPRPLKNLASHKRHMDRVVRHTGQRQCGTGQPGYLFTSRQKFTAPSFRVARPHRTNDGRQTRHRVGRARSQSHITTSSLHFRCVGIRRFPCSQFRSNPENDVWCPSKGPGGHRFLTKSGRGAANARQRSGAGQRRPSGIGSTGSRPRKFVHTRW